jgi:tRNA (guanine37-N1)-methyltransferase
VRVDVVTIFPEFFGPLELSLLGRARAAGLVDLRVHDLRAFTTDRHRTVDDTPYGGGAGMVMSPQPWGEALDALLADPPATAAPAGPRLVVLTPSGRRLDQALVRDLAAEPWLVLACGRYEGIDARFVADAAGRVPVDEVSIGDYVLAGGESAAIVVVEAVTRLLPGVLGNAESLTEESHVEGLLEYPVYTKPPSWRDHVVPEVLLSGDHGAIGAWRRAQALRRTALVRPDLVRALDASTLDEADRAVLAQLGWTEGPGGRFSPADDAVSD